MPGYQLTTIGLFQTAQNCFAAAEAELARGDSTGGGGNMAAGLTRLTKALLAELTQMSQDIAALKAEVDSLKPKPTALQRLSPRAPPVPWSAPR